MWTSFYIANIVIPDRVGRQGGTGFSGKPDEALALVTRASAASRSTRRVWGGTERVMRAY
jgi:hypothetical protein